MCERQVLSCDRLGLYWLGGCFWTILIHRRPWFSGVWSNFVANFTGAIGDGGVNEF